MNIPIIRGCSFVMLYTMLIIFGQAGIGHYDSTRKCFHLYEDGSGKRVGYVKKNRIKKQEQYDIFDMNRERVGTIKWNNIKRVWVIERR